MSRNKYSTFTNKELIQVLSESRQYSPVIEELCLRLESYMKHEDIKETNLPAECPICDAQLKIDIEVDDDLNYKLSLRHT